MSKFRIAITVLAMIALLAVPALRAEEGEDERSEKLEPHGYMPIETWVRQQRTTARIANQIFNNIPPVPSSGEITYATVTSPVRVNTDLLPQGGTAQPETQAEPYLAVNPNDLNHLIAVYQESRFANGGARALNYSVSLNGGVTWTEGILPGLTVASNGPWQRASDPWVAFGPNNRVHYISLLFNQSTPNNAIGVSTSTDGGMSWGPPVEVFSSTLDFNDKESIVADTYPDSPFFGYIYAAWDINKSVNGQFRHQQLVVSRSTDGGLNWGKPKKVRKKGTNIGVIPRVGPDGTVYAVWTGGPLNGGETVIYFSKSANGGKKWSEPKQLANLIVDDVINVRGGEFLVSFDVNPLSGELYIGWQDARFTGIGQAAFIVSRNGGDSWSAPRRISDGPDDAPAFTISIAVNKEGHLAISYYSLQNDPQRRFFADQYVRISRDGGETFEPGLRVTSQSFDLRDAAQAGGFFLGDYTGLVGTESGFQLLWIGTDLESAINPGRRQPDVFTASVQ